MSPRLSRKRTLRWGAVLLGLTLAVFFGLQMSFVASYDELDRSKVREDASRVRRTFEERFAVLESKVNDWGTWDEALRFATTGDQHFVEANLTATVLSGLNVNLVAFLGPDLSPVSVSELVGGQVRTPNVGELAFLATEHPLVRGSGERAVTGLVSLAGRPAIASAKIISNGDGSGPPAGRVIFVRIIDEDMLKSLSEQTLITVSLSNLRTWSPNGTEATGGPTPFDWGSVAFGPRIAVVYLPLRALDGEAIGALRADIPRDVVAFGERSARRFVAIFAVMIAGLMAAIWVVFHVSGVSEELARLMAAERLRERVSADLEEAQSIAKVGSWSFDLGSGQLTWSKEHYRIFEIEEPQAPAVLYAQYRARIHPDDLVTLDRYLDRASELGAGFVFDHRVLCKDGTVRFVQGIGRAHRGGDGRVARLTGTCQDVTERVRVQAELEAERAKSLRNAKLASLGELAAGVAHEINNPLGIVAGTARILGKVAGDPARLAAAVEAIQRAADRIAKIVKGLKRFSRSAEKSERRPVDLATIVTEAVALTAAKARREHVAVTMEACGNCQVACNEIEIEQVVVNLLNNAIDATKAGPERWIKVTVAEVGGEVALQVRDGGCGIDAEARRRLFQPFFTTKPVGEGTGLGLSIVKGIVEEHGATVELLEAEPNTCFQVVFQKAEAAPNAA